MKKFDSPTALVVGATSGIGLVIAKKLSQDHYVFGVGRDPNRMREYLAHGDSFDMDWGDVRDPDFVIKTVANNPSADCPIKTLVYSAGVGLSKSAVDQTDDDIKNIFDVNVYGAFRFIRAVLPGMLTSGGGQIILISSAAGLYGYKYNSAYSATKHALCGITKALAKEHGKRGVTCVCLCPGITDTPMTERMISGLARHRDLSYPEARRVLEDTTQQNRLVNSEEIAELAALIASGKVPSLNGSCILMGGGE